MNLKRWFDCAPKALLICSKTHCRLNLLPYSILLSFLRNRIMSSQLWKILLWISIFRGVEFLLLIQLIKRRVCTISEYGCSPSIVSSNQGSYYKRLASTPCLLFPSTGCDVTPCPPWDIQQSFTLLPTHWFGWSFQRKSLKKGWY